MKCEILEGGFRGSMGGIVALTNERFSHPDKAHPPDGRLHPGS